MSPHVSKSPIADVSPEVILGLIEQCRNESIPGDGEIYWKIRHYQRVKDRPGEQRWWARLSPNKRRNLKQFLKHARLAQGFDTLLRNIPGLRDGIRLGTLSTNLASHCDEVRGAAASSARLSSTDYCRSGCTILNNTSSSVGKHLQVAMSGS